MSHVVVDQGAAIAYAPKIEAAITLNSAGHSSPLKTAQLDDVAGNLVLWGPDNLLPQRIIADCRKNTIIPSTLSWKAEALYGSGLGYGTREVVNGEEKLVAADPKKFPEIERFINSRTTRRYVRQASKGYYWFKNIFPEVVLSKDRKKILSVASQRPEYCRYWREESGDVKNVYVSANWEHGFMGNDDKLGEKVPLLDPYSDPVNELKSRKGYKFIYPVCDSSPGMSFYQEAEWHSIRLSGWLTVVEQIPKFKKAIFENQITLKYLIEISTWWWEWKYPGFGEMTATKKQELMQQELQQFNDFMSGTDNSGNSLMVSFASNPDLQKEYAGWKITAIDNKLKDGVYIEDSQEASSHIMYALSVDPVLRGFTPGGKMASGGSEKRVAWNNHIMLCKPHADDILEVINFIHEYNGWPEGVEYWFKSYYQATMDVAREPQQMAS